MSDKLNYTITNHIARKELELSMNEYAVADLIYHLSNHPGSDYPSWCYASRTTIADMLDLTKQSVLVIVKKLTNKKLVEKHPITKHLRTTKRWYDSVIIKVGKESLPLVNKIHHTGKESLPKVGKESLPPIYDNDKYNNDITNIVTKNGILKKPVIEKDEEKIQYLVEEVEKATGDTHSAKWFRELVRRFPDHQIFTALSEVKQEGAKNPGALFVYKLTRQALLFKIQ